MQVLKHYSSGKSKKQAVERWSMNNKKYGHNLYCLELWYLEKKNKQIEYETIK